MVKKLLFLASLALSVDPSEVNKNQAIGQKVITQSAGRPVTNNQFSLTAGNRGPVLLEDFTLIDKLSHFVRERIPERIVHAKGTGAHGVFEVTHDISRYSKAKVFSHVGKRTPIFVRFSTVVGGQDSADTVRDPRGFSIKFYTEDGNWDMVGLNFPVFFIRDAMKFPDFAHSQKKDPGTNLGNPNIAFDFLSQSPESVNVLTRLFSDAGISDGFRHIDGHSVNTYQMVNEQGERFLIKMHFKTRQGLKNLSAEEAARLQAADPDYNRRDLYDAIGRREFPSWDFYIQALSPEAAEEFPYDVLDATKEWPENVAPLIPVGRLTLNAEPQNFFAEVEQVAFSPSHVVPGIEPSRDTLLQGRLFAYPDAQNYRLGSNRHQIPINCPFRSLVNDNRGIDYIVRDGVMTVDGNNGDTTNYEPNTMGFFNRNAYREEPEDVEEELVSGAVGRFPYDHPNSDFEQAGQLYRSFSEEEQARLVATIVGALTPVRRDIQYRMVQIFAKADSEYGEGIARGLGLI